MKTQATKLSLLLKNGSLRVVKVDELINEIENFEGQSLYTKKEQISEVQSNTMSGYSCWEFEPYDKNDLNINKVRQWSPNPFTIVNYVNKDLNR